jgi:hypothetical protein
MSLLYSLTCDSVGEGRELIRFSLPLIVEEEGEKMVLVRLRFFTASLMSLLLLDIVLITGFYSNQKVFKSSILLSAATKRNIGTSTVLERKTNEKKHLSDSNVKIEIKRAKRCYKNDKYEIIETELLNYKRMYGNMLVPSNFVIPSSSEWPELSWGFKLGITVCRIRYLYVLLYIHI